MKSTSLKLVFGVFSTDEALQIFAPSKGSPELCSAYADNNLVDKPEHLHTPYPTDHYYYCREPQLTCMSD